MSNGNGKLAIFQPMIQYGFAGLSVILIGVIVWMIDRSDRWRQDTLTIQRETNQVIERNTSAFIEFRRVMNDKM
jgi:hypothetical protein